MFRSLTTLLTAAVLAAFSWPALAQPTGPVCGAHAEIAGKLAESYREKRIGYGILADGRLLEMYSAAGGETWSLVVTWTSGMSCLMAVGQSWRTVAAASDLIRRIKVERMR
jgi:hypothetical protein